MEKRLLIKSIERIIELEEGSLRKLEKEYSNIKTGKLIVRKRGSIITFGEKRGNEEKGITKDKERVELIIRKTRLEYSIDSKRAAIGILKETVAKLEKVKYKKLNAKIPQTDILKGNYSIDDWKWMRADFESNPIYPEDLQFRTPLGTIVRTKSEWMIAMALELLGIPYRYEQVHYIAGNVYYPDFPIRKQDGTIVIWEHFGLMDNREYAKNAFFKMDLYNTYGIEPADKLIMTFENRNNPLSLEQVDRIIEDKFL